MFSELTLVVCLLIGSSSGYGPNYREPSVYTPVSYAPADDRQQPQPQQQQFLHFHPQHSSLFGLPPQQQPSYQYQSHASNFFQPQTPWPLQTPPNSYYWLNSAPQQQQPFPSGQFPSLVNYFQPQLPSYQPNSLIVIYYRAKAATKKPTTSVDQQVATVPRIESQPSSSNRYPNICKGEGIIRHPDDCLKFIRCRLSLRHQVYYYDVRSCPLGLAFDPELESCNYQANVTACASEPELAASSSSPATTASTADDAQQKQTAQTLLTYHSELPEPEKVGEESDSSSNNPSLYMVNLPQPLSEDSSEDSNTQLESNSAVVSTVDDNSRHADTADSSLASVPLAGKNADSGDVSGMKSPPPATKTGKKPPQSGTKKSPSRKVGTKRPPTTGATKLGSTKSKPIVQEKEILPARKTQKVESFTIGDSAESARMMLDEEDIIEDADQQPMAKATFQKTVDSNVAVTENAAPAPTSDHQPSRSSVHYEDEEESLASSV